MRNRLATVTASCLAVLFLASCSTGPAEPKLTLPPVHTPRASQTAPTVAPTGTPAATTAATPESTEETTPTEEPASTEWKTVQVEDWGTVTIPPDWNLPTDDRTDPAGITRYVENADGNPRVSFFYERPGPLSVDPPACVTPTLFYKNLTTKPLPDAYPAENLQLSSFIREFSLYQQGSGSATTFQLVTNLNETDRAAAGCEPLISIYPDAGGVISISLYTQNEEDLYFGTADAAEAYAQAEEHQTILRILESVRITL